jgi:hypothetical protein
MPAKDLCEKCGERPGGPWDGSGGYKCLCGRCKVRHVLGGENGKKFGIELSAEATLATGAHIKVEMNIPDDDQGVN